MPFSTAKECVKGMFLTAGATKKQAEHKAVGRFRVCGGPKTEPPVSGFHVCVFYIRVNVNLRALHTHPWLS